jgi:hypothetical protein
MARIAGITTEKDFKGNIKKVTFDFKKYEVKLRPILEELGAIEEDEFDKKFREGTPIKEAFEELRAEIRSWKWDK